MHSTRWQYQDEDDGRDRSEQSWFVCCCHYNLISNWFLSVVVFLLPSSLYITPPFHVVPFFPWLFHLNVHREHKPYFQMHKQQQPNISIIIRNHWNSLAQNWIKHFPFYIFDIYRGMFFGCENHWKSLKLKVVHLKPIHRLHRQTTKFIAHSF